MKIIYGVAVVEGDSHIGMWVNQQRTLNIARGMLNPLRQYMPFGGTIVDAGANIGDHSIFYSMAVGGIGATTGQVWAFEPNPAAYECLQHNMRQRRNVTALPFGLSDSEGYTTMQQETNVGAMWMHRTPQGEDWHQKSVKFITLDSMMLNALDFFKLDIEGWETLALAGARDTIMQYRPVMLMEVNTGALERAGGSRDALFEAVKNLGYRWQIHGGGEVSDPQYDIVCYPE